MKIVAWKLIATYEDGSEHDVSFYVPNRTNAQIESFLDSLEENDEKGCDDECE